MHFRVSKSITVVRPQEVSDIQITRDGALFASS